ncbi:50S ribosomal protein L11 methyltransferase [Altericroceibacterium spongiae]|uniref:Ribosomal protein L11 methyltransferase n=1 Tax=Altericroceibacterium spongiae TaxID=2320269 RepID=A0A420EFB9_9SPHN|nr:50S ribosomal protein L11 methyltransferase [Altericroceibacterium spongiae]RKF19286.1 50S ribosomal protein L11 methyltransferase [Altericroceibacterium spongiae]
MPVSWKISLFAPKQIVQDALLAHDDVPDWDYEIVISGREVEESRPQDWVLEAWVPREPDEADKAAIAALFGGDAPDMAVEALPETDWVTESQKGVEPIRAGRFHIRTPDHPVLEEAGVTDFAIPASQAFGTGQHRTTAGCLAMLTEMKKRGVLARNIADIGTGTGLLAFAALDLWPAAKATASDIDAVCAQVVADNAQMNGLTLGAGAGETTMVIADGMDDPLLQSRGPYDLLIANILAGPLIELAQDFAASVSPRGHVLLAGLLTTQEPAVRDAYRRAGFRLSARLVNGDWSILWLRRRFSR